VRVWGCDRSMVNGDMVKWSEVQRRARQNVVLGGSDRWSVPGQAGVQICVDPNCVDLDVWLWPEASLFNGTPIFIPWHLSF
jgi:hypothetical protein